MNTFADLVQAAQSLQYTEIFAQEDPPSAEEATEFLKMNKPHLDAARNALSQDCHVEIVYSEDFFEKHMDDVRPMRDLARAFNLELAAAEREGRLVDAIRAGICGLDLAGAIRRGGLMVDMLVAVALSGISLDALRRLRHRLGMDELQLLLNELQRVESQREPFADVAARDEEWERRFPSDDEFDPSTMEWPDPENDEDKLDEEVKQTIITLVTHSANQPREERMHRHEDTDNRDLALLRLLAVESALLAYRLTHRSLPASLDRLTPETLAEVPLDPFADESFRYRVEGDDFVLYSVGKSQQDAGGRMGSWIEVEYAGTDLFLDAFDCDPADGCFGGCALDDHEP